MNNLNVIIFFLTTLGCTSHSKDKSTNASLINGKDSLTNEYLEILSGLKYEYVLYYRNLKVTNTDLKSFGLQQNDSIFRSDSVRYFESYQRFYQQDYRLIEWLLKFRNDTTKSGLWQKYLNPVSSYIGECNLPMSNSRAAINLLENLLNEKGFECYECKHNDSDCNTLKYEEIEKFLELHKGDDIYGLRKGWKTKNAR